MTKTKLITCRRCSGLNHLICPSSRVIISMMHITHGIQYKRAILLSPTGSGKSFIMYLTHALVLSESDEKSLIIVPTTSLVEQLYSDFKDYGLM
jgi:replicative superfamily II helicase